MDVTTRELVVGDHAAAMVLEHEAFGYDPDPADPFPPAHTTDWGSFDAGGRLVARAAGRVQRSWFRGVRVESCGIADVTVHAEARGAGLVAAPLRGVLATARERGAVVSTMYPTAPGIYRRLGYELVGSYDVVELPTAAAAAVRAPDRPVTLRRAGLEDVETMRSLYDAWAADQNGPLDRRAGGSAGTDDEALAAFTAITLALDEAGEPIGYAAWDRGRGYTSETAIEVRDLIGSEPAVRALWRLLGSFSSVAPRIRLKTSAAADTARLMLPTGDWRVVETHPYALRVDDVCGAFAAVPVPPATASADVAFAVAGDRLGDTDGDYVLSLAPGQPAACVRTDVDSDRPVLDPRGLALAWAGVQSCANLRRAGLLTGPTTYDATLDRLLLGPPLEIRNYF